MSQFTAVVFQEDRRYRVVVDGLGMESAGSLFEAEDAARRLIERHVRASYPERAHVPPEDAIGAMSFRLDVVRSDGTRERRELWVRSRPSRGRRGAPSGATGQVAHLSGG
ncbi:MAG: hypothetical protein L3K14_09345 [Thermoplasmata archaeon]|nr:hypothetical protein [Thermoplasmata archaeon]